MLIIHSFHECSAHVVFFEKLPDNIDRLFSAVILSDNMDAAGTPSLFWHDGVLSLLFYHNEGVFLLLFSGLVKD